MAPSNYNPAPAHVAQRDVGGDSDEVLDAGGVMALLGVGRNAIYAACARNEIPHRRIGKALRFRKSAVMRWLDSCGRSRSAQEGQ
jgi:excisionase family DNA binding protein